MKACWLHRSPHGENTTFIVLCHGWGMDEKSVAHLDTSNCQVLCLYDYRSHKLPPSLQEEVAALMIKAPQSILIAWSLGVYMSAFVRHQLPSFDTTLALNGTPHPIDAQYGIMPAIYDATERTLSHATRDAFMQNAGMAPSLCRQNIPALQEELISVRHLVHTTNLVPLPFDAAFISRKDRIFPTRNQQRWWQTCPNTQIIMQEGTHYPFANTYSWLDFIHAYSNTHSSLL